MTDQNLEGIKQVQQENLEAMKTIEEELKIKKLKFEALQESGGLENVHLDSQPYIFDRESEQQKDLEHLQKVKEKARERMLKDASAQSIADFSRAKEALENHLEGESPRYFHHRHEALKYLQAQGYKIQKSKFYNDSKAGLIRIQPNGRVYEKDLRDYAKKVELSKFEELYKNEKKETIYIAKNKGIFDKRKKALYSLLEWLLERSERMNDHVYVPGELKPILDKAIHTPCAVCGGNPAGVISFTPKRPELFGAKPGQAVCCALCEPCYEERDLEWLEMHLSPVKMAV